MTTDPDPVPPKSDQAPARATDLAIEVALARALAQTLARARDLTRALACNFDVARELAFILDRARDLAHFLDPFLDPELALHLDVASDVAFTVAFDRSFDVTRARALTLALDGTQVALNALSAVLEQDSAGAADVADLSTPDGPSGPEASRAALRLARLTVRCLPVRHRARYREEYAAELSDLAGVSRGAQWRYTFNIVARALVLRRDLRRADRVPAGSRWLR